MSQKQSTRQQRQHTVLPMVGNSADETLDSVLSKVSSQLGKLFEDRNIILTGGGTATLNAAGTSLAFTANFVLYINQNVAGAAPYAISLSTSNSPLAFSVDGNMAYLVINRTAQTATLTTDSATLPAAVAANQEIVMIAKRVGTSIFTYGGFCIAAGGTSTLGRTGSVIDTEFSVNDSADSTKKIAFDAGGTTATKTTITAAQTANRVITLPDATDTLVGKNTTDLLLNKVLQAVRQSVTVDATTTGANATVASFTAGIMRLTNASLSSVSGLPAGLSGQSFILENQTGNAITINNQETTAAAADRIYTGSGTNTSMPANSAFSFVYDATATRWMLVGGTGSGSGGTGSGKNYLTTYLNNPGNGDFEAGSTTGWSKTHSTLDSTTKLPNQASGSWSAASANLALTAVTSGKLAGSYSGQIQQSTAASVAGDMIISDAFTLDVEDQEAKIQSFKINYKLTAGAANTNFSGTSSNSFGVAIYDVTQGVWIQPAGVFNFVQNSGSGICTGTIQTNTGSTQYRLAIYFPNTSTGTFTMLVDDISFGPQITASGAVVSDWTAFTPTGSWTANTTYTGQYKRVGDMMHLQYFLLLSGAPTAANLTVNLPSGFSIDSTKLVGGAGYVVPESSAQIISAASGYFGQLFFQSSTSLRVVTLQGASASNNYQTVTQAIPNTFINTDGLVLEAAVPISGWSSNTVMSNDTDTRVVAMQVQQAAPTATITSSYSLLKFTSGVLADTHSVFSTTTGGYTVPVTGFYRTTVSLQIAATYALGSFAIVAVGKNSTTSPMFSSESLAGGAVGTLAPIVTGTILCNAGDVLYPLVLSNGTTPTVSSNLAFNYFMVERLSGPATIAASESVNFRYSSAAGQSTPTGTTIINFDTKEYDSHNAVTTGASWKFTVPVSGKYNFSAFLQLTSQTGTASNTIIGDIFKNGSLISRISGQTYQVAVSIALFITGSTDLNLLAGDIIDFRMGHQETTNRVLQNIATLVHFEGKRVGN